MSTTQPEALRENYTAADMATAEARGFRDGVASVAASAGSEPVAHLWQHSETGRTRVVMPDMVVDASATWLPVGPLYLHPSPQEGAGWKPIETAPKDGRTVLVFPATWSNRTCSTAKYDPNKYAKKPQPYWDRDDAFGKLGVCRERPPTHWMPLPAPPASEAKVA